MKELGFGIIGCGTGMVQAEAISSIEGTRLVAVVDVNEERARENAERYKVDYHTDYKELLKRPDIDIVGIATPNGLHAEIAVDAAKAGKHLIIEKPLDITLKRTDMIIDAADEAGVKVCGIFQNRFLPDFQLLKKLSDEKRFGKLIMGEVSVKWHRKQEYYNGWQGTWKIGGGGALITLAIHYIDLLIWLMGPIESVHGYGSTLTHKMEVEDVCVATLKFKNGGLGIVESTSSSHPLTMNTRIGIWGDKGAGIVEGNNKEIYQPGLTKLVIDGEEQEIPKENKEFHGHILQIRDFVDAIKEGREPLVDGKEARKALEVVLAIYASIKIGKEVKIKTKKLGLT